MNRDEILQAARTENKKHEPMTEHIATESGFFGHAVGCALCFVLMLISEIITGETDFSCVIVYFGMEWARALTRWRISKEKKALIGLVCFSALLVFSMAVHIISLMRNR